MSGFCRNTDKVQRKELELNTENFDGCQPYCVDTHKTHNERGNTSKDTFITEVRDEKLLS